MIVYTVNAETKAEIIGALSAHGTDPRMSGALGRVKREDSPLAIAGIVEAWPADADGRYRISLSYTAGTLVWRAYAIAYIARGGNHGRLGSIRWFEDVLGVATEPAYEYVCHQVKGRGVRPCANASRMSWSSATKWVVEDGDIPEPRRRWARSTWRGRAVAHDTYREIGLALTPNRGAWSPCATLLFHTPKSTPVQPMLSPADEAALMKFA
jgi:hypothetical protein